MLYTSICFYKRTLICFSMHQYLRYVHQYAFIYINMLLCSSICSYAHQYAFYAYQYAFNAH